MMTAAWVYWPALDMLIVKEHLCSQPREQLEATLSVLHSTHAQEPDEEMKAKHQQRPEHRTLPQTDTTQKHACRIHNNTNLIQGVLRKKLRMINSFNLQNTSRFGLNGHFADNACSTNLPIYLFNTKKNLKRVSCAEFNSECRKWISCCYHYDWCD